MLSSTRRISLLATLGVSAALLMCAPSAFALSNLTVDDPGDNADIANDGVCDATGAEACTLRAAIQEADDGNTGETDTIGFSLAQDTTITILSALPTLDEPTTINGCSATPNHAGPCIDVHSSLASNNAFNVTGAGVTIAGLAIGNADVGISAADGSTGLVVRNDWFGIQLPAATPPNQDPNNTGILLMGSSATIGGTSGATGTTPADRNVFSYQSTGVRIFGGDDNQVLGNYIGTRPDGTTAGSESEGVEVASELAGPDTATDNLIGAAVSLAAAGTTTCDGACNVISGAANVGEGIGIDMSGDGGAERPSSGTVVAGNFVGLDTTGTALLGNNNSGVKVNNATSPVVGGPATASRNYITGPAYALFVEPTAIGTSAVIQNNYFGLNSNGSSVVSPVNNFAQASLRGNAANPVLFEDNRLAENDTDAVRSSSYVTFHGNTFGIGAAGQGLTGGFTAITVSNSSQNVVIGGTGPGDGNTIANATSDGIQLNAAQDATIQGNYIGTDSGGADRGNGNDGIGIFNGPTDQPTDGLLIGGDTAAAENVISNNAHDGIGGLSGATSAGSGNVIARNRSGANGSGPPDLFLDLGEDGPGNASGFNAAIQPPAIASATTAAISGTAQPNAVIRVYRTSASLGSMPGDLPAFAGQATADGSGNWTLSQPSFVSAGDHISANQTGVLDGSSELSPAVAVNAPAVADVTPPETSIGSHPKPKTRKRRATFTFSSSEPGSTFLCSYDGKPYAACSGSFTTPKLKPGKHRFDVIATDSLGNRDQSPATFRWKVKKRRR